MSLDKLGAETLGWKVVLEQAGTVTDLGDGNFHRAPGNFVGEKASSSGTVHEQGDSLSSLLSKIEDYEENLSRRRPVEDQAIVSPEVDIEPEVSDDTPADVADEP